MRKKLSEQMNGYTLFINEKELGPELAFIKKDSVFDLSGKTGSSASRFLVGKEASILRVKDHVTSIGSLWGL